MRILILLPLLICVVLPFQGCTGRNGIESSRAPASPNVYSASGNTYTAASCNENDVNAVINGPTHAVVNGDTIIIPPGTCSWTSGITISGVGIDITGQGTPNTGGSTVGAGTPSTSLINNASAPFFTFTGLSYGQTAKVELLTMSASGAGTNAIVGSIVFAGSCTASGCANIRVDNINYTAGTWENALAGGYVVIDDVFGVVDHNTANEAIAASPALVQVNYSSWQGVGDYGDNSFASTDTFGTAQSMFIENNMLTGVRGSENDVPPPGLNSGGARYVCRFNTVANMSGTGLCSAHGTAWSGRPRGQRQVEVYYNTVGTSPSCDAVDGLNAGVGYYFSNSVSAPGGGCNEFVALDIPTFVKTAAPWNNCDASNPYDQSPWSSTSQCVDQVGRGAGQLLEDFTPVLASQPGTACTTGGQCWPNPVLDPIYEAGEVMVTGGFGTPVMVASDGSSTRILANRDYYAEVSQLAQNSPTSPFNGMVGTGYGTLANRPTTCTQGVGYWATDQGNWNQSGNGGQGQLFVCTATNTWTLQYTPYTYPHPLASGTNSTPTPTPTAIPTPTLTPVSTPVPTPPATPSPTPSATPTPTPVATPKTTPTPVSGPTTTIISPVNGATVPADSSTVIESTLQGSEFAYLEFLVNGKLESKMSSAPYSYNWRVSNIGARYRLKTRANNESGELLSSSPQVSVTSK